MCPHRDCDLFLYLLGRWKTQYTTHTHTHTGKFGMKVNIKAWKGVAVWAWDVPKEEVCGICRVPFDGTCPSCKYPGDECPLVIGECTHRFHEHCIVKWLDVASSRNLCPMCRQSFKIKDEKIPHSIDPSHTQITA